MPFCVNCGTGVDHPRTLCDDCRALRAAGVIVAFAVLAVIGGLVWLALAV